MKSTSPDELTAAPPDQAAVGQEPASRTATDASAAGNARRTTRTRIAPLMRFAAEIVTAILECPPF